MKNKKVHLAAHCTCKSAKYILMKSGIWNLRAKSYQFNTTLALHKASNKKYLQVLLEVQ
jgi:hypothetical protein